LRSKTACRHHDCCWCAHGGVCISFGRSRCCGRTPSMRPLRYLRSRGCNGMPASFKIPTVGAAQCARHSQSRTRHPVDVVRHHPTAPKLGPALADCHAVRSNSGQQCIHLITGDDLRTRLGRPPAHRYSLTSGATNRRVYITTNSGASMLAENWTVSEDRCVGGRFPQRDAIGDAGGPTTKPTKWDGEGGLR
jgi:hypothetical protein